MLILDDMRKEFAEFLSNDPAGRWRMDAALAHVVTLAYEKGIADGKADVCENWSPLYEKASDA